MILNPQTLSQGGETLSTRMSHHEVPLEVVQLLANAAPRAIAALLETRPVDLLITASPSLSAPGMVRNGIASALKRGVESLTRVLTEVLEEG